MFEETPLKDLLIYKPQLYKDHRGYFFESFNQQHFTGKGLNGNFVQDNCSFSKKGSLRGLHFQCGKYAQAKLVGVLSGRVYDVVVDLRSASPTFKSWYSITLDANKKQFLYIPRGFAHGFLVLSENAEFFYKVDNNYNQSSEAGIHYNDQELNIPWPLNSENLILSEKDLRLPTLSQYLKTIEN